MPNYWAQDRNNGHNRPHKSRICVQLKRSHSVAKMFRSTLSVAIALVAATALFATTAQAQSGLRFNPGGFTPSAPYSTSTSILDLMPASPSEAAQPTEPVTAAPQPPTEAASVDQQAPEAQAESTETAIHQGLAPEKANSAAGLGAPRGASASPSTAGASVPTDAPSPYLAPSPYTTPRSPGGGLKIR